MRRLPFAPILFIPLASASLFALTSVNVVNAAEPAASAKRLQPKAAAASTSAAKRTAQHTMLPPVVMHKNPSCNCCMPWAKHLEAAGFKVTAITTNEMDAIKKKAGVPSDKTSCHTAMVAGYFIEGHVPVEDIKRLLAEKPAAKGLTAPGMPLGSPGMEVPDGTIDKYTVELVLNDGTTRTFARHGG